MSGLQIIILGSATTILFGTLIYLLIFLFSKIHKTAKAKDSKTMDDLEQNRPFKL